MPKQQLSQKQLKFIQFLELLEQNSDFLHTFSAEPTSSTAWGYIKAAALQAKLPHPPHKHAANLPSQELLLVVNNYHHASKAATNSTRLKKHELTAALGLGKDPLPYGDLATQNKLTVILRDHLPDKYKCGNVLVDCGNEDLAVAGGKCGLCKLHWWILNSLSFVAAASCALSLIAHVNEVIEDVGAQSGGVSANPWWQAHPIWVECWSLTCLCIWKLDSKELAAQDKSILGIMSLTWNLLTAALPKEVIHPVKEKLAEAGLPPMASPGNIKEHGYEISLPNGTLSWSTAEHAPAEAYIPIHTDQLYAPYALNWVTMHEVIDHTAAGLHVRTKGSKFPRTSGGNYVDVSLGVVVKCATDTAMAMKPTSRHGTTLACPGVKRQGTAINFATHIKAAFDKAMGAGVIQFVLGVNQFVFGVIQFVFRVIQFVLRVIQLVSGAIWFVHRLIQDVHRQIHAVIGHNNYICGSATCSGANLACHVACIWMAVTKPIRMCETQGGPNKEGLSDGHWFPCSYGATETLQARNQAFHVMVQWILGDLGQVLMTNKMLIIVKTSNNSGAQGILSTTYGFIQWPTPLRTTTAFFQCNDCDKNLGDLLPLPMERLMGHNKKEVQSIITEVVFGDDPVYKDMYSASATKFQAESNLLKESCMVQTIWGRDHTQPSEVCQSSLSRVDTSVGSGGIVPGGGMVDDQGGEPEEGEIEEEMASPGMDEEHGEADFDDEMLQHWVDEQDDLGADEFHPDIDMDLMSTQGDQVSDLSNEAESVLAYSSSGKTTHYLAKMDYLNRVQELDLMKVELKKQWDELEQNHKQELEVKRLAIKLKKAEESAFNIGFETWCLHSVGNSDGEMYSIDDPTNGSSCSNYIFNVFIPVQDIQTTDPTALHGIADPHFPQPLQQ
ncbi:hypothetical protein EDC04DRAFT_2613086 [Pisolithus marmoratus]|nr:hypothetical protein EDC04DRAFT_2613086 [Pisolithus marmoratus]